VKIGINGYEAVVPRFGFDEKANLPIRVGSSEYCYQLIKNLAEIDKKNNYFIYLPVSPTLDMPPSSDNLKYIVFSSKKLWTLVGLSKKLTEDKNSLDVFFSPTHYLPITNKKSVISILDVSYLKYPKLFKKKDLYKLKVWGRLSIKKAEKILTISQASKSDIIKEYGVRPDKVAVVYPGVKSEIRSSKSETNTKFKMQNLKNIEKFGIKNDYILFVGTLQPRKNIVRLIEAFSMVVQKYSSSERSESRNQFSTRQVPDGNLSSSNNNGLQLVIVGKKGWQYEKIFSAPEKFNVSDKVLFIEDASDEDLPALYKNAKVFILPSLYEGFGLPILEAMQNRCPVIASNVSSLPEAGGDAALYVDPNDTDDIKEKMEKLLEDENLRKELIEKGYEQVKKFSWEKSAREVLKVLEEVGKSA